MGCFWGLPLEQTQPQQDAVAAYYAPQRTAPQIVRIPTQQIATTAASEPLVTRRSVKYVEGNNTERSSAAVALQQERFLRAQPWQLSEQQLVQQQQRPQQQQQQQQQDLQQFYQQGTSSSNAFSRAWKYLMSAAPSAMVKTKEEREEEKYSTKEMMQNARIEEMAQKVTLRFQRLREMDLERYRELTTDIEAKDAELGLLRMRVRGRPDGRPTKADELAAVDLLTSKIDLETALGNISKCKLATDRAFREAQQYIHNKKRTPHTTRITMAVKGSSVDDEQVEDELTQADDSAADMAHLNEICFNFNTQNTQHNASVESRDSQIAEMVRALFAKPPTSHDINAPVPAATATYQSITAPNASATAATLPLLKHQGTKSGNGGGSSSSNRQYGQQVILSDTDAMPAAAVAAPAPASIATSAVLAS